MATMTVRHECGHKSRVDVGNGPAHSRAQAVFDATLRNCPACEASAESDEGFAISQNARIEQAEQEDHSEFTVKRQSARAIAAAKTRALKAEIAAAVAQYTPDADGEAAALAAYFAAHTENVRTWAAAQAAATAFGYDSPEDTAARRASLAADRAAMVARCVYATVKSNARYMAMYGRVI